MGYNMIWKMRRDLKSQNINNVKRFIWDMTNKSEVQSSAPRIPISRTFPKWHDASYHVRVEVWNIQMQIAI
jgi:hypothetical protein